MNKSYKGARSFWLLIILLLAGGLAGSAVSAVFAPVVPWFKTIYSVGWKPFVLNFGFMKITFGFMLDLGLLTVVGLILGYLAFRKL